MVNVLVLLAHLIFLQKAHVQSQINYHFVNMVRQNYYVDNLNIEYFDLAMITNLCSRFGLDVDGTSLLLGSIDGLKFTYYFSNIKNKIFNLKSQQMLQLILYNKF